MLWQDKRWLRKATLPTPYPIGDIFAYLVRDDPVTVIDAGVRLPEVEEAWKHFLKENGLTFRDIKRIVITHGHSDHYGYARRLAELSGAKVYLHPADFEKVKDRRGYYERMLPFIARYGIPGDYMEVFVKVLVWERPFCEDLTEDMLVPLEGGSTLEFEHTSFEVIHTPGHSLGHVILKRGKWALTGDFIFSNLTPIPTADFDEKGNRIKTMPMHIKSIEKVLSTGLETFLPAHREEQGSFPKAVEELKKRMRKKEELIAEFLKRRGKATPYEVICHLYPEHSKKNMYVLISEILGRLDVMEQKGIVGCELAEDTFYYFLL